RERALIANLVEGPDNLVEVDVASSDGAEVPATARIAKGQVRRQDARPPVERHLDVFGVHVEDPVREGVDELHGVDALPEEVAGVEVKAEGRVVAHGLKGPLCRVEVKGDFGGVHLEGKLDAFFLKDVEDGPPDLSEVVVTLFDVFLAHRREGIDPVPNRGARKAGDDVDTELASGPGGLFHLFDGPLPLALRIARQ